MEIKYFVQNFVLDDKNKKFLEEKIKKLEHFSNKIWEAKVDVSYNPDRIKEEIFRLEINLKMPNKILRGVVRAANLQTAIDQVEQKLKKQLRKYKGFGQAKKRLTKKIIRKIKRR
ncbi:ribosome-associated translation inhibitor RaiA [Patescibacteria group bacterium]|nr:ribosome-associated translation inhibitor RaiA [Patescibacteria group bacterium]